MEFGRELSIETWLVKIFNFLNAWGGVSWQGISATWLVISSYLGIGVIWVGKSEWKQEDMDSF